MRELVNDIAVEDAKVAFMCVAQHVVQVRREEVALEKFCNFVHVFTSESRVVEATVILAEPSNDTPLMVRGVASFVAVPAFPLHEPDVSRVRCEPDVPSPESGESDVIAVIPASVPHESTPEVLAFTSQFAALRPETTSDVLLAVPLAVMAVVEAKGNREAATVEEAKNTPPVHIEVEVADVVVPKFVRQFQALYEPSLLLNVVQSVPVRHPVTPDEAEVHPKLPAPPPSCAPIVPENVIGAVTPSDVVAVP